ncbi:ABC transporter substrate-binding protein [Streptomyces sp. NPDC002577]
MIPKRRFLAGVVACAAALVLGACGGGNGTGTSSDSTSDGKPVAGGTARVIQILEPQSLDPATMGNAWAVNGILGNALYGTLVVNDVETGKVRFTMAKDFSTTDGGATFQLKLRPGLKFSDGTALDAEAVKVNWDRLKDPKIGSNAVEDASLIASSKVVDATTLKVTLVAANRNFPQVLTNSPMNWIASPKALKAGRKAFDAKPVGAGPFTLTKWTRQNSIELAKNPTYWDAPKPYLDRLVVRTSPEAGQRLNTVTSGGADMAMESNWDTIAKAHDAGLATYTPALSGGFYLAMNTKKAPFNDVRARRAVAAAFDLDAYNLAVYNGKSEPARTLFAKSSPFYSDIQLTKTDKATAQKLFDELAAEGKPVSFTFKAIATSENKAVAENIQAQLSSFKNVKVKIQVVDAATFLGLRASYDYDMILGGAFFGDPEPRMWAAFHGDSRGNQSRLGDEKLNAALQEGRTAASTQERKAAYEVVQERLKDLVPVLFVNRAATSVIASKKVHGVVAYGMESVLPEELWIQK